MKVIVGLGNPGEAQANNRHNVGFMTIDKIKEFDGEILKIGEVILVKPQSFMNRSGEAVSRIVNFYKVSLTDLIVVHDDLDIRLGEYKVQKGVGPKVHNGITSIESRLGTKDFWRVRIGIDNRTVKILGEMYVLSNFTSEEKEIIGGAIENVVKELERI